MPVTVGDGNANPGVSIALSGLDCPDRLHNSMEHTFPLVPKPAVRSPLVQSVFFMALFALWSTVPADAQESHSIRWRVASTQTHLFGGGGWGGAIAVSVPLTSIAKLPVEVGLGAAWTKPALSGRRTSGVPNRRTLLELSVDLRKEVVTLPGSTRVEIGVPVTALWSTVGETTITEAIFPGPPPHNIPGREFGFGFGLLGAISFPITSRVALTAETAGLVSDMYRAFHTILRHRVGVEFRLP